MPGMTAQEIRAALAENEQAPNGPIRIARAEYLAEAAEACGDAAVRVQALLGVINSYEFGAEQPKMLVPFARLLKLWDGDAAAFDRRSRHSLFWCFKWATSGMVSVPEVPLSAIEGWLAEMESRYRQAGHSPRPVHMGRHRLARAVGDMAAAEREFEAWLDAPRDTMADCHACEAGGQGGWHAFNERDELALELWQPVLAGELACAEEPHRVLSDSLLPLVRLGRFDEARANHLRGYRMARGVVNLRSTIAGHIEFCALTGNEARGLEILTEHAAFLQPGAEDADSRLDFLTGTLILLRRLIALDLGALDLAGSTVAGIAESVQAQITALCARFDARNGNAVVSRRTAQRLGREPLVASLPLGSTTTLPRTARRTADSRQAAAATGAAPASSASLLEDLIAQAQRLTEQRDPRARQAWQRVAATGVDLPAAVAARVERSKAASLMRSDPAAARAAFAAVAARFDDIGEPGEALDARAGAAFAAHLSGEPETAVAEAAVVGAEAETAFAAGELTVRQYLAAHGLPAYLAFDTFTRLADSAARDSAGPDSAGPDSAGPESVAAGPAAAQTARPGSADPKAAGPDPALVESTAAVIGEEVAFAERLGDLGRAAVYHRMLARLAFFRQDNAAATSRLKAAREAFLAAGQTWDAAEPEGMLAQLALHDGDGAAAEQYVRDALAHAGDVLGRPEKAQLGSLLVEVLSRQGGREPDLIDAALRAAELWEGLSEPDTLHNRFTAARAYAALDRFGEAAALFDELMPRVDVPYDRPRIAMTREQYGDCLTQLGEHRKAAEQYLAAAALVQDDPHNRLPHARVAWSAAQALQSAGLFDEALPAYRRVAELWGELGNTPARVRCLRSAAWLVGWESSWTEALELMHAVLSELKAVPREERSEPIEAEIGYTAEQIDQMLAHLREAQAEAGEAGEQEENAPDEASDGFDSAARPSAGDAG